MTNEATNQATPPTLERLEDQIAWYDRKSRSAQRWFKSLKVIQLMTAGLVPIVAVFVNAKHENATPAPQADAQADPALAH